MFLNLTKCLSTGEQTPKRPALGYKVPRSAHKTQITISLAKNSLKFLTW